jgi:hypothetical protein
LHDFAPVVTIKLSKSTKWSSDEAFKNEFLQFGFKIVAHFICMTLLLYFAPVVTIKLSK